MNSKCVIQIIGLILLYVAGYTYASDDQPELNSVDCGECHGHDGNSTHPLWPSLAGQNTEYLIRQIAAFQEGTREHPQIGTGAKQLSDSRIKALADYYSSLEPTNTGVQSIENHNMLNESLMPDSSGLDTLAEIIKYGESFYTACSGCHGVDGEGVAPYPRLAGQQPEYLRRQLLIFKSGERKSSIMKMMVTNLNDEDIYAVAIYLATLRNGKFKVASDD